MLISHEINYAMDHAGGEFGLSAQRKSGEAGPHHGLILALAKRLAEFGALLEADPRLAGGLALDGGRFLYQANDRLRLPNTPEAFAALQPDLEAAAGELYGGESLRISRVNNDPRERLAVLVESTAPRSMASLA
ncbi:MAG: hypothetical protein ACK5QW_10295 [Cyanobacteriota bacterium]